MNFKQLVNDFMIETSMDDVVVTVLSQDDEVLRATTWIRDAWVQIQRGERWDFMWRTGVFTTKAGKADYTRNEQERENGSKADFTSLCAYPGRQFLNYTLTAVPAIGDAVGPPRAVASFPNETIRISPTPDKEYSVSYSMWDAPVFLENDLDTPSVAPAWHKAIVWLAIANYAREQGKEWNGLYTAANRDYNHMYTDMLRLYLPQMLPTIPLIR